MKCSRKISQLLETSDYKSIYTSSKELRKHNSRLHKIEARYSDKSILDSSNRDTNILKKP